MKQRGLYVPTTYLQSEESKAPPQSKSIGYVNNMFVECLASMIICFGAIYVPHFTADPLAQLVTSVSIVAIMMNLKDRTYFCPDATPVVTLMLLAAGAYTGKNDGTISAQWKATLEKKWDVLARLLGQMIGAIIIICAILNPQIDTFQSQAFLTMNTTHGLEPKKDVVFEQFLPHANVIINEMIATTIEAIASAFVIIPLLRSASTVYTNAVAAKEDATPPSNKDLFSAATSLGILHFVLERLFRATMNPVLFGMQCTLLGEHECPSDHMWYVIMAQLGGIAIASAYVYTFIPDGEVLKWILEPKNKK